LISDVAEICVLESMGDRPASAESNTLPPRRNMQVEIKDRLLGLRTRGHDQIHPLWLKRGRHTTMVGRV
jgi:hypothetical protein